MPVLDREIELHPADLLDRLATADLGDAHWWVLYTCSRKEKALARRLHARSISFYLPTRVQHSWCPSGKAKTTYLPFFPSYVFVHGDREDFKRARISEFVSSFLEVQDEARLTHDLRQLYRLIESDAVLTLEQQVHQGDRVRICTGPMKGIEGNLIRKSGRNTLVVSVDFIGQGAAFEADDYLFETIEKFVPHPEDVAESHQAERRQKSRENPPPFKVLPKGKRRVSRSKKQETVVGNQASAINGECRDVTDPIAGQEITRKKSLLAFRRQHLAAAQNKNAGSTSVPAIAGESSRTEADQTRI